ncbi:MAG: hypothetical protein GKR77_02410 [Legionellales bacterium]|nr:hypothetical protein [Legionellales bacterium]
MLRKFLSDSSTNDSSKGKQSEPLRPPYQDIMVMTSEQLKGSAIISPKAYQLNTEDVTEQFRSNRNPDYYAFKEKTIENEKYVALLPIHYRFSWSGWLRRTKTKTLSGSQKKQLSAFFPHEASEQQQRYLMSDLPHVNPRRTPKNLWKATALAIATQSASQSYQLDPTLMMCMPIIAIGLLLLHRRVKTKQWTSVDLKDAGQWGLNLAGASIGFNWMNTIAETQLGMTALNDFVGAAAIHGKLVLEGGLEQLALLAGQASLGAIGFAAGLMAIHFITSVFRTGLEKAYQEYNKSGSTASSTLVKFAHGVKHACRDYFSKENGNLLLVTFVSVMMSITAKLLVSGLVASGVLTAGIAPLATIVGAILLTTLVNYGITNRWGHPKPEAQKLGFFDSAPSDDDEQRSLLAEDDTDADYLRDIRHSKC